MLEIHARRDGTSSSTLGRNDFRDFVLSQPKNCLRFLFLLLTIFWVNLPVEFCLVVVGGFDTCKGSLGNSCGFFSSFNLLQLPSILELELLFTMLQD